MKATLGAGIPCAAVPEISSALAAPVLAGVDHTHQQVQALQSVPSVYKSSAWHEPTD